MYGDLYLSLLYNFYVVEFLLCEKYVMLHLDAFLECVVLIRIHCKFFLHDLTF